MYITLTVVGDTCERNLSLTLWSRRKRLNPCRKLRPGMTGAFNYSAVSQSSKGSAITPSLDAKTPWLPLQLLLFVALGLLMQAPCRRWAEMNATSVLNCAVR
ncbi:hypothetical protein NWF32_17625 [Pseudomonas qingdaonensis]|nr:hypothetical protein [Pseudomonas qingdaonensis]